MSPASVELLPPPRGFEDIHRVLLTKDAVDFVAELSRAFASESEALQRRRSAKKLELAGSPTLLPSFPVSSSARMDPKWRIAPLPPRLRNRRLDMGDVSPADGDTLGLCLKADVQGIQVDFDDGHCPTWKNQAGTFEVLRPSI